ncbi:MAG: hypothetical protein ACM37W_03385, partial [Actinomycetota bacterium]
LRFNSPNWVIIKSFKNAFFRLFIIHNYQFLSSLFRCVYPARESVLREQQRRREERGGFNQKIMLLWTELQKNLNE